MTPDCTCKRKGTARERLVQSRSAVSTYCHCSVLFRSGLGFRHIKQISNKGFVCCDPLMSPSPKSAPRTHFEADTPRGFSVPNFHCIHDLNHSAFPSLIIIQPQEMSTSHLQKDNSPASRADMTEMAKETGIRWVTTDLDQYAKCWADPYSRKCHERRSIWRHGRKKAAGRMTADEISALNSWLPDSQEKTAVLDLFAKETKQPSTHWEDKVIRLVSLAKTEQSRVATERSAADGKTGKAVNDQSPLAEASVASAGATQQDQIAVVVGLEPTLMEKSRELLRRLGGDAEG